MLRKKQKGGFGEKAIKIGLKRLGIWVSGQPHMSFKAVLEGSESGGSSDLRGEAVPLSDG